MTYDDFIQFVQGHFSDGLITIVGSGLSMAEGLPGMPHLADHLKTNAHELVGPDRDLWSQIESHLPSGLEFALLRHPPTEAIEAWISRHTCNLLIPAERSVIASVIKGERELRLTAFLKRMMKPTNGLPILTTNYDRLVEVACEMAGFHVDTTAIGMYAGTFDHTRSFMASCKGVIRKVKTLSLDHFPRAIVLKPHGSLDWYRNGYSAIRCSLELDIDRQIITPGLNKYRAGYNIPFDKHRELANNHINRSARLLVVGYGFNDDHLQTHLESRIREGTPTLILTRSPSPKVSQLVNSSPACVCVHKSPNSNETTILTKAGSIDRLRQTLWDIAVLTKECLL